MKKITNISVFLLFIVLLNISCNPQNIPDGSSTGTVKDKDGNIYHTVKIGTQTWMVENLITTKFNDGTSIPIEESKNWEILTSPAYSWYNNDAITYKNTYGALYNWYAINSSKLAPLGWHIPTQTEWTTLRDYVSVSNSKALASNTNWEASLITGAIGNDLSKNNSTGFSALPGGWRTSNLNFSGIGQMGWWWSATNAGGNWNYVFYMHTNIEAALIYTGSTQGMSVRCIKD